ncbi:hypothetical protein ACX801_18005 [Arthrobacter bambusae]
MTKQLMHRIPGTVLSLAGTVLVAVLLAGCASAGPVVEQTQPAAAQGSPPPSYADATAIGGSGGPAPTDPAGGQVQGGKNQPPPMQGQGVATDVPVWDAAAEKEAINVASNCMALFTLKDRSAEDWKRTMANGCLTPQAQKAWANVRPDLIPVKEILAMATLDADRSNPYWVWATVPTNDGDYRVQLNRTGAGKPWLIDLIRPKTIHQ